jgi:sugar phosphate isomerase/epimerase
MDLGISSVGNIFDLAISNKFKSIFDLLMEATKECFIYAEEHDIKVCELLLDPPDVLSSDNKMKFIDLCNSFSLKKRIHGPFIGLNLCSNNQYISRASVDCLIETAKLCNQIGAEVLTIHSGSEIFGRIKLFGDGNRKRLIESVNNLLDATADLNVKICIENLPNAYGVNMLLHLEDIEQFFNDINRNDIFMTWDTSHSWTCDIDLEMLWKKFHKVIKNIHLVDNFKKNRDSHPALGSGKIDFQEIFDVIKKNNYNEALIVEIASARYFTKSIDFIKKFL